MQLIEKKIRLCLPITVSITQHLLFAFVLRVVGIKIIKNRDMCSQNFCFNYNYIKHSVFGYVQSIRPDTSF